MSSWVENQQREAFLLYKRYLGIDLHFRSGAGYDYTIYNGSTKSTLATFLKKPKIEIAKFIQLSNRLKGINQEEFLFANARYDNLNIQKLLGPEAVSIYKIWKHRYGDRESFVQTVFDQFNDLRKSGQWDDGPDRLAIRLLGGDDLYVEPIAWLLQNHQEIGTVVRMASEENIIKKMMLTRIQRIQSFYSYFLII